MGRSDQDFKRLLSNQDVQLVLNSIYDAVYIVNTDREIVFWNKAAESITGYMSEEVISRKCSDNILNHVDENGNCLCSTPHCPLVTSIDKGANSEAKVYPLHKNSRRFPSMVKAGPVKDSEGNIIGAIEIFRDITNEEDYRILQEKFKMLIRKYVSGTTFSEVTRQTGSSHAAVNQIRDVTVLFMDIIGFTRFSEKNSPEVIIGLLNDIFGICEVITNESYGDIDKFIGDALMATFIDANDAVRAAKRILEALTQFNRDRVAHGNDPVHLRFGLNSGTVIQAEIGTPGRKDLTVIGDIVNTASGIERMSEPDTIFVTLSTYSRLKDITGFGYRGKFPVKGRQESIDIYAYK